MPRVAATRRSVARPPRRVVPLAAPPLTAAEFTAIELEAVEFWRRDAKRERALKALAAQMPRADAADRTTLTAAFRRAATDRERIILTYHGMPVAAVVPWEDAAFMEERETESDVKAARRAERRWKRSGRKSVPLEQVVRSPRGKA